MLGLVVGLSLLLMGLSGWGLVSPRSFVTYAERFEARTVLWLGVVSRLAFALALWASAADSGTPGAFRVLAALFALGAALLPVLGAQRIAGLFRWGLSLPPWAQRPAFLGGLALGLFMLGSSLAGLRAA